MIESTFKDKAFESFVMKAYEEDSREIFPVEYEGEKYWVKKARATSSNFFHKFVYKLINFSVLAPVESKSEEEALIYESNKLLKFKSLDIKVPTVVGRNGKFFVITDSGENIYHYINVKIRKKQIDTELYECIDNALYLLSQIHNQGLFHGGPQLRNFTFLENKVYTIDLEDSFSQNISLEILQFRDFLLFLLSLCKLVKKIDINFEYIIKRYVSLTGKKETVKELKELCQKINTIKNIMTLSWVQKLLPDDSIAFIYLMNSVNSIEMD